MNIARESILAKLPILEIQATIQSHTASLMEMLPDKRLKKVLGNMLLGILGGQTPVVTGIARQNGKTEGETWAVAKSMYRLLGNKRLEAKVMYQGLYEIGQQVVPADVAAVVFSANPITGNRDEIMINASWGLGESIVGGTVTPDTFIARKSDLEIIQRVIADKQRMTVSAPGGTQRSGSTTFPAQHNLAER